jgi:hypothetical protein
MRRDRVAFGSRADKGEHLVGTLLVALERAVAKHAGENREKGLDLVEPDWRAWV